ncbi:MAG: X-Pro dipeptidyl-peptidase domain protein [Firmicutes bacterium]|nr:X-Pro dipeptidyl-peptidase domain protein [Bacillota bacterium]
MSHAEYDVIYERNVRVPMRDGVHLASDLYYPARSGKALPGPFPVIVERTPYDKLATDAVKQAKFFARRGYMVLLQDVRGRYASEGEFYPFRDEAPDGVDTCAWVVAQPWCDGRIATVGLSYGACTETALAAAGAPGVAAQFIAEGYHNYHNGAMRQGGAMELRFMIYGFRMAANGSPEAAQDPVVKASLLKAHREVAKYLRYTPMKKGQTPLRFTPGIEQWVLDVLQHGEYSPYWSEPVAYSIVDRYDQYPDVPVYWLSGWYDTYIRSTITNFNEFRARKQSPQRLIMGPWIHGVASIGQSYAGDVDFGPDAAVDYDDLRLRWFDHFLKEAETGVLAEPPVRIFVMGGGSGRKNEEGRLDHGGQWRYEHEFPLPRAVATPFYLRGDGLLATALPAAAEQASSAYVYDPRDPVPTIGGSISAVPHVMPGGGFNQRGRPDVYGATDDLPLGLRPDVLVFSTPPLVADVEVTGPMKVVLYASSTAVDTDFTAKLIDVYPPNPDYPDGYELNISDSIIRVRYRDDWDQPAPMVPGTVYPLAIELYATANLFRKGHQIRLHISSSNFPRFDVNPNTGAPLGTGQVAVAATQTIYHDPAHPSHILLPLVPGAA